VVSMHWPGRRISLKAGLTALGCGCIAALLAGPAVSGQAASPVMRVDFSFSAVGGKRPPDIVETRVSGKGRLAFDSPTAGVNTADSASGTIVVEYDVLTPHPQTLRMTLKVTGARWNPNGHAAKLDVEVLSARDGDGDPLTCPPGSAGFVSLLDSSKQDGYYVSLPACKLRQGQTAAPGANSRVHVTLTPTCLRLPSARKPLCGGKGAGTKPKPPAAAGTFTLRSNLTEVKNAAPTSLTINAAGGTAHWNCCPGGGAAWVADYTFKVPGSLVAGKTARAAIGMKVSNVKPEQPLALQISLAAPDFRKDVPVHYPDMPTAIAAVTFPIAAGYATSSELLIVVGLDQGQIIYHYRK